MKEFISLSFICKKYYTWVCTLINRLDGTVKISVCEKVQFIIWKFLIEVFAYLETRVLPVLTELAD
jgi:hypothetical protein